MGPTPGQASGSHLPEFLHPCPGDISLLICFQLFLINNMWGGCVGRWDGEGEDKGPLRVCGEWSRQSEWSCGISLGPTPIHGTRGVRCTQGWSSHCLGSSPLLSTLEAVDLGKHICNFIL